MRSACLALFFVVVSAYAGIELSPQQMVQRYGPARSQAVSAHTFVESVQSYSWKGARIDVSYWQGRAHRIRYSRPPLSDGQPIGPFETEQLREIFKHNAGSSSWRLSFTKTIGAVWRADQFVQVSITRPGDMASAISSLMFTTEPMLRQIRIEENSITVEEPAPPNLAPPVPDPSSQLVRVNPGTAAQPETVAEPVAPPVSLQSAPAPLPSAKIELPVVKILATADQVAKALGEPKGTEEAALGGVNLKVLKYPRGDVMLRVHLAKGEVHEIMYLTRNGARLNGVDLSAVLQATQGEDRWNQKLITRDCRLWRNDRGAFLALAGTPEAIEMLHIRSGELHGIVLSKASDLPIPNPLPNAPRAVTVRGVRLIDIRRVANDGSNSIVSIDHSMGLSRFPLADVPSNFLAEWRSTGPSPDDGLAVAEPFTPPLERVPAIPTARIATTEPPPLGTIPAPSAPYPSSAVITPPASAAIEDETLDEIAARRMKELAEQGDIRLPDETPPIDMPKISAITEGTTNTGQTRTQTVDFQIDGKQASVSMTVNVQGDANLTFTGPDGYAGELPLTATQSEFFREYLNEYKEMEEGRKPNRFELGELDEYDLTYSRPGKASRGIIQIRNRTSGRQFTLGGEAVQPVVKLLIERPRLHSQVILGN